MIDFKNIFKVSILFILTVCYTCSSWAQNQPVQDNAAEYYFYRCAGCHTVGGGKLSGPDLIQATQWKYEDLKAGIKKMEKNVGLMSEQDIQQMIDFLKDIKVAERITRQKQKIEASLRAQLPPPSFEKGEKLFTGEKTLVNRGPACFSCHRFVNEGGSLGLDLTNIKDRASSVVLQSGIENSSYKIMRAIYLKHKITTEESLHLAEYLSHPEKVEQRFTASMLLVKTLAMTGFGIFILFLWAINKRRKGPTRRNLVRENRKR